jgi:hypothetical protein
LAGTREIFARAFDFGESGEHSRDVEVACEKFLRWEFNYFRNEAKRGKTRTQCKAWKDASPARPDGRIGSLRGRQQDRAVLEL